MLDLELVSVRSAPGIVVKQPAPNRPNAVSIEVLEPEDPPVPRLALPPPPSQETYYLPCLPASAPLKKRVHRLSAKKAAVLAEMQSKLERKQNRKVCPLINDSARPVASLAIVRRPSTTTLIRDLIAYGSRTEKALLRVFLVIVFLSPTDT